MQVIIGKIAKPRRCVLYGVKGIGKSTWAAGSPSPIFMQAEEGLDDIGAPRLPLLDSWDSDSKDQPRDNVLLTQFDWIVQEGKKEGFPHRTLVVDSLDGIERLIFARVAKDKHVDSIEEIPYQAGYKLAKEYWIQFIDCLEWIRGQLGMNIILLAHSMIEKFDDPESGSWDKWNLQLHKNATPLIVQWADEVFFATYKVYAKTTKESFGKEKVRGLGTGERFIKTTERPSQSAKNRLDMPDEIPFPKVGGWDIYAGYAEKHHAEAPAEHAAPAPEPKKLKGRRKDEGPAAVAS